MKVETVEPIFALVQLKRLVNKGKFSLVQRKAHHASPVTKKLAQMIVAELSINDFVKVDHDRNFPDEYVWIFITSFGVKYYIKFKFLDHMQSVRFISFHEAQY